MREIKFRAWNAERKIMFRVGDDYGTTHDLDCAVYFKQGQHVELMQFTGLRDKNGKEIYEGDRVRRITRTHCCGKIQYETTGIIEWFAEGWAMKEDDDEGYCGWANQKNEEIELIGNIYENPELLK